VTRSQGEYDPVTAANVIWAMTSWRLQKPCRLL
jgi:hypothetical protein